MGFIFVIKHEQSNIFCQKPISQHPALGKGLVESCLFEVLHVYFLLFLAFKAFRVYQVYWVCRVHRVHQVYRVCRALYTVELVQGARYWPGVEKRRNLT